MQMMHVMMTVRTTTLISTRTHAYKRASLLPQRLREVLRIFELFLYAIVPKFKSLNYASPAVS